MAFRSKKRSVKELLDGIQAAAAHEEYNPRADMTVLREQYRELRGGDFARLLDAMCEKYDTEWSLIHSALVDKDFARDTAAIKMLREEKAEGASDGGEVNIIDDIG